MHDGHWYVQHVRQSLHARVQLQSDEINQFEWRGSVVGLQAKQLYTLHPTSCHCLPTSSNSSPDSVRFRLPQVLHTAIRQLSEGGDEWPAA